MEPATGDQPRDSHPGVSRMSPRPELAAAIAAALSATLLSPAIAVPGRRHTSPNRQQLLAGSSIGVQQAQSQPTPPSEAELRARRDKLIENQHHDDEALEQYERIEHELDKSGGSAPRILSDKTYRVVPTGAGTFRMLVKTGATPVDPQEYRRQLAAWRDVLELVLNPNDSRSRNAGAKWQKKKRDRSELVEAGRDAFIPKWLGQETLNGHLCDILELTPNAAFHPRSTFQEALARVNAKIWVDHASNQLVRGEAHVIHDISFGGGILGKLYRGGVFWTEQAEVAPGVWLPARYQYDFTGRKFLFVFEEHQYIELSRYRRLGSPKEALQVAKDELASGGGFNADP
jgi:hypothetical protein